MAYFRCSNTQQYAKRGLICWLQFNRRDGSKIVDLSGNGNDAYIIGNVVDNGHQLETTESGYILLPKDAIENSGHIEVVTTLVNSGGLDIYISATKNDAPALWISGTIKSLMFNSGHSSSTYGISMNDIITPKPYTISFNSILNGDSWLDGEKIVYGKSKTNMITGGKEIHFGHRPSTDVYYPHTFFGMRIYQRELYSNEVVNNFNVDRRIFFKEEN